jgi:Ulp1 family protease
MDKVKKLGKESPMKDLSKFLHVRVWEDFKIVSHLFIPVEANNHWFLMVMDLEDKAVRFYDTLRENS